MNIVRHKDAAAFLAATEPWLLADEPANNLLLGVARRQRAHESSSGAYWASIERAGRVVGCALRTPPYPLVLSRLPIEAVGPLVSDVRGVYATLPGVNGPRAEAEALADRWCRERAIEWRVRIELRAHVLTSVNTELAAPPGGLRLAQPADTALIEEWVRGFIEDAGMRGEPVEATARFLESGRLHVWDDAGPKCMAAAARETPRGISINAVYTPPAQRRKGYATATVAELSRRLLAEGKAFCCLYTDVANATSNAIYERIGYRPIRDDVEIEFLDAERSPGSP